ncbi:DUF2334 domain-containing protein [Scleromatobacter humisilvae]|uniref:DUF2334 domain-containing protein n=1 Tax=Scleromatobacter humisilvae TaxID=2897159 RepID=A0A9X1YLH5_9BURK|nr:DUF2334 domain-containing protein [Scleromatobacter humisilvae]MCK9688358.1 DUF2334 domain-containing protein [Scleromatobacter humisilvae]
MSRFIVRFDDICPGMDWSRFAPFEAFFAAHPRIKPLLGVVPDNRDPKLDVQPRVADFWARVRSWRDQGWTIAQHGYTHVYSRPGGGLLGIGSKSEFTGLPLAEQQRMLAAGQAILQAEGVWQPYFMAPSHSFDLDTLRALRALGFKGVTDGFGVYPYEVEGLTLVPQLLATPRHLGFGLYTICLHTNEMNPQRTDAMLRFMADHEHAFIGFEEALARRAPAGLGAPLRAVTQAALHAARRRRH